MARITRSLDEALGAGLPRSAMVEFYGPSGCGKSTLALQITAHLQRNGLNCAWIDADRTVVQLEPRSRVTCRPSAAGTNSVEGEATACCPA